MSKQTFDFSEALRRMKEGKWVKRAYYAYPYALFKGRIIMLKDGKRCVQYLPFYSNDILATDWEEVEP